MGQGAGLWRLAVELHISQVLIGIARKTVPGKMNLRDAGSKQVSLLKDSSGAFTTLIDDSLGNPIEKITFLKLI